MYQNDFAQQFSFTYVQFFFKIVPIRPNCVERLSESSGLCPTGRREVCSLQRSVLELSPDATTALCILLRRLGDTNVFHKS